jgi:hypothetical protein
MTPFNRTSRIIRRLDSSVRNNGDWEHSVRKAASGSDKRPTAVSNTGHSVVSRPLAHLDTAGAGSRGGQQQWGGQQRQLSQQDVNEVVRQLIPALPQILAQAQTPFAGIGYAAYGQAQRQLSPQDVNEVVRQLLPTVPQIVGMLQSQPQMQHAAMHGGFGQGQQFGGLGQQASPMQGWGTQFGAPQFQAVYGGATGFGQQRQLSQQDVADITRQLIGVIPQVIGNLQAYTQQRTI